ncbi:polyketide cyclase [Flavobacterium sp. Root935]|uniref:SRPBCC family protein n=1 Tax=unclassified Flavobacterium TaxID=196869 RepID=UPI000708E9E2|nr:MULTISPECIES: SRPBCC family protein [unclassified Flavobacterium]KRD63594.1 polyketide cyclase [Flavobacterium sp. Root935]TDX08346.1 polyketide cyclase/dehydrase/lipid transport protein [Flavobacterium sp. S87F.05.LMB.W.Kidney.N]
MIIIKRILVVLILIISLVLIVAYFMPKEYMVEREITINKPVDSVFKYVKSLRNQNEFSVWANIDPKMKVSYKGTDGTVGSISSWESNVKEVGVGEQEITKIKENRQIDFALRFKKPMEDTAVGFMSTEPLSGNQTKVKWEINGKIPYPTNIMLPMLRLDQMIGKDLQKGLENLKNIMEEK